MPVGFSKASAQPWRKCSTFLGGKYYDAVKKMRTCGGEGVLSGT
jgi:hypothetical protein